MTLRELIASRRPEVTEEEFFEKTKGKIRNMYLSTRSTCSWTYTLNHGKDLVSFSTNQNRDMMERFLLPWLTTKMGEIRRLVLERVDQTVAEVPARHWDLSIAEIYGISLEEYPRFLSVLSELVNNEALVQVVREYRSL